MTSPDPANQRRPTAKPFGLYAAATLVTFGFALPFIAWHWTGRRFTIKPVVSLIAAGLICLVTTVNVIAGDEVPKGSGSTGSAKAGNLPDAGDEAANEATPESVAEAKAEAAANTDPTANAKQVDGAAKARTAAASEAKAARAARKAAQARRARAAAASSQADPRFGTCGEANDAGYGPYSTGDAEYPWYEDRDSDGVVCET